MAIEFFGGSVAYNISRTASTIGGYPWDEQEGEAWA